MAQAKVGNAARESTDAVRYRSRPRSRASELCTAEPVRLLSAVSTTWSDLDERAGVLDLGGAKLSLYLLRADSNATSTAWWTTEDGNWLMNVIVGLA